MARAGIIVSGGCGIVCASKYAGSGIGTFGIAVGFGFAVALAVRHTAV
jgi:glycerol uptake facilitator-like aquaporin